MRRRRGGCRHAEIALVVCQSPRRLCAGAGGEGRRFAQRGAAQGQGEARFEQYGEELLELLHSYRIELVVLAGFLTILPENVIHAYPKRILNIHPSLIPSFCGAGYYGLKVHEAALAYGVKVTGATVHYVNEIPDGGEIIAQKAVAIQPGDTPELLQRRVMEQAEWQLLPQAVEDVAKGIDEGCAASSGGGRFCPQKPPATSIGAAAGRLFPLRKAAMLSRHWRLWLPFPSPRPPPEDHFPLLLGAGSFCGGVVVRLWKSTYNFQNPLKQWRPEGVAGAIGKPPPPPAGRNLEEVLKNITKTSIARLWRRERIQPRCRRWI